MHTFPALLLALTLPLVAACPPRVHPKVHPEVTKPGPMSFHTGQNNSAPVPSVPPKSDVSTQPTTRRQMDNAPSSNGVTTRYWDCCKPSCGWPGKASVTNPVKTCDARNNPLSDPNAPSACGGGASYTCGNQSPMAISSTLSYGYAAVKLAGKQESDWCCACYELTFTSGPVAGKKMVVQATNTGGDLGDNHFDLAIPGGGVGQFNGCTSQYNSPSTGWGQQYGGISSYEECDKLPAALKPGCQWRFGWFKGADNPSVSFREVECPSELTAITGCERK